MDVVVVVITVVVKFAIVVLESVGGRKKAEGVLQDGWELLNAFGDWTMSRLESSPGRNAKSCPWSAHLWRVVNILAWWSTLVTCT